MWLPDSSPFSEAKKSGKPLILDGAIGSLLQKKGVDSLPQIWTTKVLLDAPQTLLMLHLEYIAAGADIITTHTFRTNPAALSDTPFSPEKLVPIAVSIAAEAASDSTTFIAGSNPPAEDCYSTERNLSQKKLEYNHAKHIDLLYSNGVHFILNETLSHLDEIKIISTFCSKHSVPYVISLYLKEDFTLLSGEHISSVLPIILDHAPGAIAFNCISPHLFNSLLDLVIPYSPPTGYFGVISPPEQIQIAQLLKEELNWGFYLNCGIGNNSDDQITKIIEPAEYLDLIENPYTLSPSFIGSCCGSTPAHTHYIKRLIDG